MNWMPTFLRRDGRNEDPLQLSCLSLDLEVSARDQRIYALAGILRRPDRERVVHLKGGQIHDALAELDELAQGVEFLLGHNIERFDLPHLRAMNSQLGMLTLPVVDTLLLSPLAFPQNPYHYLVKHYQDGQLRRGRINDPELDARLTLELFEDQLTALKDKADDLLLAWHWLTTVKGSDGYDMVFSSLRQRRAPSDRAAMRVMSGLLDGQACSASKTEVLKQAERHGWPLAYALAWLSVAGGNSVMPPWVTHQFPETRGLIRRLRDAPCHQLGCGWCVERHDSRKELKRWFGFDEYRPEPTDADGVSLQQSVVESVMRDRSVLAILPTGTGKSVCYQVPALSRYDKTGALTVVISPLVALMADQVAGLEQQGISSAVTINGMLSLPERADALDRVRLGDASILIIAPEQLRSVSVRRALEQRQIGYWVLDEAHCLSKWGHAFRPDYKYLGRYIRERAGVEAVPPVLCLTAAAKPEVLTDIVDHFSEEVGVNLAVFDGGSFRPNLEFAVVKTSEGEKFEHTYQIISTDLLQAGEGGAIVYCSTRRRTEEMAAFLDEKGVKSGYYHGRLSPEAKKEMQQGFIEGEIQVIAATNAFGMGIDKPDVRLVVHADIPGSLENYLQEAGRAGRDRTSARCILMYTSQDVDRQFGLSAGSRLTRREIQAVLKGLRNIDRRKRLGGEVIATSGEILRDEDVGADWERDSATDDTRVRTAVSWLEDAALLTREENRVEVFPSSLMVSSLLEARERLEDKTTNAYRAKLLAIVQALLESDPDEGVSTDSLMMASGLSAEDARKALHDLAELGIASNDIALTAFVRRGVQHSSDLRFKQAAEMESATIELLRENSADMDVGESSPLYLRSATQRLKDEGCAYALPEQVRRIISSVAADGRGDDGKGGSLSVRRRDADSMQVTLRRDWKTLARMSEVRRNAASRLLDHLLSRLPQGARGVDLLAETTMGNLLEAMRSDMMLRQASNPARLMERALLWLHEQEVIRLNKGLTVFRPAMTIRLADDRRGFTASDFAPLGAHYDAQTVQVHIMNRYAQSGLESMTDAVRLAMDYFALPQKEFLERWLPVRGNELTRQTTGESWHKIVDSLRNPHQRRIVVDDRENPTVLVLAGPGSGKTRVLVHRIAYLIRARRQPAQSILALAYNRHAAVEIRRRLAHLIGEDARGVIVLTCHALSMRLTGETFVGRAARINEQPDFKGSIQRATALLQGDGLMPDEADDMRDRLLAGFRWILVDEYQDISEDQYALISALAGRTLNDSDDKISLFAVGDDDQNIYSFSGASVEFVRRYQADYAAQTLMMTQNYRSTKHIIAAANAVIASAKERMKADIPIEIDRRRARYADGGDWAIIDPVAQGRVQILPVGREPASQAEIVVAEMKRMAELDPNWDWTNCAVVARNWRFLDPVRGLCEKEGIPVQMANEEFSGIWFLRETEALRQWLSERQSRLISSDLISEFLDTLPSSPWVDILRDGVGEYAEETGGSENPDARFIEWLAEWGRDLRQRPQGLMLLTAHRVKGLEFDHVVVLDGNWSSISKNEDREAPRRLYYVAMTRAKKTLTLAKMPAAHPFQKALEGLSPNVLRRQEQGRPGAPAEELFQRYRRLSLRDVFLSFAGYRDPADPLHKALADLIPGDRLGVRKGARRWELLDCRGRVVGQLATNYTVPNGMRVKFATVLGVAVWGKEHSEPEYHRSLRSQRWEVVIPELVLEPDHGKPSVYDDTRAGRAASKTD